jgi:predicted small metal-binding protein
MAKQITCECGRVIRGATDGEVIESAREHISTDHPDLVDKVSEDDLRGWIEEV